MTSSTVSQPTFAVAIPTYKRPDFLRRAVASLSAQTRVPDSVIVVSRDDDLPTIAAINELINSSRNLAIRHVTVSEPGFLPPVLKAIQTAVEDVFVLMDDDAEAHTHWLKRIESHYQDPRVGGVGGRVVNYFDGVLQTYAPATEVATLRWYGYCIGNMYKECAFTVPRNADFLMGGNLSYRLDLLRRCLPDARLANNVAFHWEIDVGLQIKKTGHRIIFDPQVVVDHHSAPREISGLRTVNYQGTYWHNYNYALLMRKHLSKFGFVSYLLYSALFGSSSSPGIAYLAYALLNRRDLHWRAEILASVRGRISGALARGQHKRELATS